MYDAVVPRPPWRARALVVAALALTAVGLAAGPAHAGTPAPSDVTCGGHVTRGTDPATPERLDYLFACSGAVKSYTIVSSAPVGGFDVGSLVFSHGTDSIVEADSFFCEGPIPGDGFNCTGSAGLGNDVQGNFELSSPVCDQTTASMRPKIQVVIADANGATAGPFRLRGPEPCPRPAARRAAARRPARGKHTHKRTAR